MEPLSRLLWLRRCRWLTVLSWLCSGCRLLRLVTTRFDCGRAKLLCQLVLLLLIDLLLHGIITPDQSGHVDTKRGAATLEVAAHVHILCNHGWPEVLSKSLEQYV